MDWLFNLLVRLWRRKDKIAFPPDVIVSVSFGAFPDRLTNGTERSTREALDLWEEYDREPMIVFAVFSETADGSGNPEKNLRMSILQAAVIWDKVAYGEAVASSIDEAVENLWSLGPIGTQDFLTADIVTDEGHSRRARRVWKKETRRWKWKIRVRPFKTEHIIERDHPMPTMRSKWKWLIVNVGVYCLWRVPFVYGWFRKNRKKWRQPVSIKPAS